jgi:hypothetical protein
MDLYSGVTELRHAQKQGIPGLSPKKIREIWVDALNPRPKVWQSVDALLRTHFPDLRERYRRILFDSRSPDRYLAELRSRVSSSAARFSLDDRVSTGF